MLLKGCSCHSSSKTIRNILCFITLRGGRGLGGNGGVSEVRERDKDEVNEDEDGGRMRTEGG